LGDICDFERYKNIKEDLNGNYNFYSSSLKIKKCSKPNINGEYLIFGSRGTLCIHYYNGKFGCSNNMILLKSKKINIKYLYYILKNYNYNSTGSVISMITKKDIENLQISIPKSEQKIKKWVDKINKPNNIIIESKEKLKILEDAVQINIKKLIENNEMEEIELREVCNLRDGYDFYRNEMDERKLFVEGENYPLLKINDNEIKDYVRINTKYKNSTVQKNDLIIGNKGSCGKIRKVNVTKAYIKHGILKFSNIKINKFYLYYFLLNKMTSEFIKKYTHGSVVNHFSKKDIEGIKINIPKDRKLLDTLYPIFEEIESLDEEILKQEYLYNQYIKELQSDAIKKTFNNKETIIISDDTDDEFPQNNINEINLTKKKQKKKKSKNNNQII